MNEQIKVTYQMGNRRRQRQQSQRYQQALRRHQALRRQQDVRRQQVVQQEVRRQQDMQQQEVRRQQDMQQQEIQRQEIQRQEDCGITFKIQTTKYLLNIANALRSILHNIEFSASVMSSEEISREIESGQEIPGVHYIFLCIGHMFHLPKKSQILYL